MRKNIVKTTTITETEVHLGSLRKLLKLPTWGALELLDEDGKVVPCVVRWTHTAGSRVVLRNTQITRR